MEISLRLDTLGMVEVRYLRGRERYRDWPQFQLLAASRQARVFAHFSKEVAEQLHQQILTIEAALGLHANEDENETKEKEKPSDLLYNGDNDETEEKNTSPDRDNSSFSPAFAQALKQLNELARQRLGDSGSSSPSSELSQELEADVEEDALEQLQDAFIQMMEVVRELAEEMSTDALKLTSRFKCVRTSIELVPRPSESDEEDDSEQIMQMSSDEGVGDIELENVVDIELELVMILQLFEEGHSRVDDLPAVELQLDVDDFERLHETLDFAIDRELRHRRRR